MQYVLVLITQIVLLCAMFTFGAKVVDLSQAKARATNACDVNRPPVAQEQDGFRQYLSC